MLVLWMALACGGGDEVVPNGGANMGPMENGPGGQPPNGGPGNNAQGGPPNQGQQMGGDGNGPNGQPPGGDAGNNAQGGPPNQGQQMGGEGNDPNGPQAANDEDRPTPQTFIYNSQSDGNGPLYKAKDGTCFFRSSSEPPMNGDIGPTETVECPAQMSQAGWENCPEGRLIRYNVGDKEGTCECEPLAGTGAVAVDCPEGRK